MDEVLDTIDFFAEILFFLLIDLPEMIYKTGKKLKKKLPKIF